LNHNPENVGTEALLLRRLESLAAILTMRMNEHGSKLDELRADLKGLRIDLQGEIRQIERRVADLETFRIQAQSAIGTIRFLFGTSIGALVLAGYEVLRGRP
jgi:hypothetical protein